MGYVMLNEKKDSVFEVRMLQRQLLAIPAPDTLHGGITKQHPESRLCPIDLARFRRVRNHAASKAPEF